MIFNKGEIVQEIIAETVVETLKFLLSRTGPTIDEIFQLSNNIQDNLQKHMGEEEFEEKAYKFPRSRMRQVVEEISEGKIGSSKYSYEYLKGWQRGRFHYQENKEEYNMLEYEEITPLIPNKNIIGKDENYVNGYKAGIEHEIDLREYEEKREREKKDKEIEETNANAEIDIAAIESILALKQGDRNKVLKTLGVTEKHLEGMLISLKNIETEGENFYDNDYVKLANEYRGDIVDKNTREGIVYGVMRYKFDQDELESRLEMSPMSRINEKGFGKLTDEMKKIMDKERNPAYINSVAVKRKAEVTKELIEEDKAEKRGRVDGLSNSRGLEIAVIRAILATKDEEEKNKALKELGVNVKFLEGQLEGLISIQKNPRHYVDKDLDDIVREKSFTTLKIKMSKPGTLIQLCDI